MPTTGEVSLWRDLFANRRSRVIALICSGTMSPPSRAPDYSLGAFAAGLRDFLDELAQGSTYWNDEAMGSRDFKDLDEARKTGRAPLRRRRATQSISRNCCDIGTIRRTPDRAQWWDVAASAILPLDAA